MPSGSRIRSNSIFGTVSDNPLAPASTSMNSNQLVLLPAIVANHAVITLDPIRQFGDPEIVIVTAHTPASTVATIQRGAYGTIAREHPQGTVWVHAALDEDFVEITTSGTRPTDPYRGQKIFETDTNRYIGRSTVDVWQQEGLFFDPPACRVAHNVDQSIPNGAFTPLAFNSERYDTDSMHNTAVQNTRITFNTAGLYVAGGSIAWLSASDYQRLLVVIQLNGTTLISGQENTTPSVATTSRIETNTVYKFTAGDFIELLAFQLNGAAAARSVLTGSNFSPEFFATWIGRGN